MEIYRLKLPLKITAINTKRNVSPANAQLTQLIGFVLEEVEYYPSIQCSSLEQNHIFWRCGCLLHLGIWSLLGIALYIVTC